MESGHIESPVLGKDFGSLFLCNVFHANDILTGTNMNISRLSYIFPSFSSPTRDNFLLKKWWAPSAFFREVMRLEPKLIFPFLPPSVTQCLPFSSFLPPFRSFFIFLNTYHDNLITFPSSKFSTYDGANCIRHLNNNFSPETKLPLLFSKYLTQQIWKQRQISFSSSV